MGHALSKKAILHLKMATLRFDLNTAVYSMNSLKFYLYFDACCRHVNDFKYKLTVYYEAQMYTLLFRTVKNIRSEHSLFGLFGQILLKTAIVDCIGMTFYTKKFVRGDSMRF